MNWAVWWCAALKYLWCKHLIKWGAENKSVSVECPRACVCRVCMCGQWGWMNQVVSRVLCSRELQTMSEKVEQSSYRVWVSCAVIGICLCQELEQWLIAMWICFGNGDPECFLIAHNQPNEFPRKKYFRLPGTIRAHQFMIFYQFVNFLS